MAFNSINQLSLDTVKNFMVERGGRVTNHELVKHFKLCLMNCDDKGNVFLCFFAQKGACPLWWLLCYCRTFFSNLNDK